MNNAHLTFAATHSNITRKQYERRTTMHSLWKLTLVLSCSALMLTAPLPAFAAAPDMYVKILSSVGEPPLNPTVWKVDVAVGNQGTVAPGAAVYAFLRAYTASGLVCETGLPNIQGKLTPGTSFKAFRFQVTHPTPTPFRYTIEAEIKYLNYQCQPGINDNDCTNNLRKVTLKLTGGTPKCVNLLQ